MEKPTILLVEDDAEVARLYKEIFAHRGWRLVLAMDGETAIEHALEVVPHLIILDLMLPKKGGLYVLKILKSLPETRHIPIMVVTAYPNPEYKEEARSAGCDHYYLKSELSHAQIVEKIAAILAARDGVER
jgi:CheY-like chemotaxis protein